MSITSSWSPRRPVSASARFRTPSFEASSSAGALAETRRVIGFSSRPARAARSANRSSPSTLTKLRPSIPPRRTASMARASGTANTARSSSSVRGSSRQFTAGTTAISASPPVGASRPAMRRAAQCSESPPAQRSQRPHEKTGCIATLLPTVGWASPARDASTTTPTNDAPRIWPSFGAPSPPSRRPRMTSRSNGVTSACVTRTSTEPTRDVGWGRAVVSARPPRTMTARTALAAGTSLMDSVGIDARRRAKTPHRDDCAAASASLPPPSPGVSRSPVRRAPIAFAPMGTSGDSNVTGIQKRR